MVGHERPGWAPAILRDMGEDDSDFYMVGIREAPDPDAWSLTFMECDDADDEQEIAVGMDTYCLVVDPGQATHYGGVRECELKDGRLHLILTSQAATALGMPVETWFALELTPQQSGALSRGLERVLTSGRADAIPHRYHVRRDQPDS
jgi:hypothetical protein